MTGFLTHSGMIMGARRPDIRGRKSGI